MLHFADANGEVRYRLITKEHVSLCCAGDIELLRISPTALTLLAEEAMREVAFKLRTSHLEQLAQVVNADDASANDRFVAHTLLRNACVASHGVLPLCQDTGTATVVDFKGERDQHRRPRRPHRGNTSCIRQQQPTLLAGVTPIHVRGVQFG